MGGEQLLQLLARKGWTLAFRRDSRDNVVITLSDQPDASGVHRKISKAVSVEAMERSRYDVLLQTFDDMAGQLAQHKEAA